MTLEAEVFDALDYCLRVIGDHTVEGEAAALRQKLANVQQLPYSEHRLARVSDEYGDPRQKQAAARSALAAAQKAVEEADAAVAPLAPMSPAQTSTPPEAEPVTDTTPAPSFSS